MHGPITDDQRLDLVRIRRSEEHLLGIISDILDFASIERGQYRFEIAPVPLPIVVDAAVIAVASLALAKAVRLVQPEWHPPVQRSNNASTDFEVLADAQKLRQALINLLSNAIKFADPGTEVVIAAEPQHDGILVSIADSGRGIPADRLASIFEPFTQIEATLTRATHGVGLGLAISRQLLRGMGSDIPVESTLGVGSRISVLLERASSGVPAQPATLDIARRLST